MTERDAISIGAAASGILEGMRPVRPGVETWTVTDRAAWLRWRRKDVTASVAAAVLNAHDPDIMTPYKLWAMKTPDPKRPGLMMYEEPKEETEAMERGRLLEPVAVELIRRRRPEWKVWQPNAYWRNPKVRLGATPDALAIDPDRAGFGVVQIKSVEPSVFRRKWISDDGAMEPPLWIGIQTLVEAYLTGASWAAVAPMRVGYGLYIDLLPIEIHLKLMARLEQAVSEFWALAEAGKPPTADYGLDGAAIAAVNRPDERLPALDLTGDNRASALVAQRERMRRFIKRAEQKKKTVEAELVEKLAGRTIARLADGRNLTRKMQHRGESIVAASSYPVLRISKGAA
jgi:hypothetical protein